MNDKKISKKIEEDIEKNLYEINMNIDNLEYDLKSNILNCEEIEKSNELLINLIIARVKYVYIKNLIYIYKNKKGK